VVRLQRRPSTRSKPSQPKPIFAHPCLVLHLFCPRPRQKLLRSKRLLLYLREVDACPNAVWLGLTLFLPFLHDISLSAHNHLRHYDLHHQQKIPSRNRPSHPSAFSLLRILFNPGHSLFHLDRLTPNSTSLASLRTQPARPLSTTHSFVSRDFVLCSSHTHFRSTISYLVKTLAFWPLNPDPVPIVSWMPSY